MNYLRVDFDFGTLATVESAELLGASLEVTFSFPSVGPTGATGATGPQGPAGSVSGTIAWTNVTGKPSTFPPESHTHTSAAITDFAAAVAAVSPPVDWNSLTGKPSTFAPSAHTHSTSDIVNFGTAAAAAAPVQSVAGRIGAVTLNGSDIDTSGNDDLAAFVTYEFADGNGIYYPLPDSTLNNKRVYRTTTGHHVFFQSLRWHITDGSPITANIIESSDDDNAAWPWLSAWDGSIEKAQLSTVVGRARSTFLFVGDSIPNSSVSGLSSVAASGAYNDLTGKPTLGTASTKDAPAAGNASSTQVVLGNDTRLSDARTPSSTLAHAASHAAGGSDPVVLDVAQVASVNGFGNVWGGGESLADVFTNVGDMFYANQSDFAAASHTHGNITSDGKVGSTSGLPVVTTTAGAVTTLALGTAGQVLRTKSDLSGVEFADPAAAGVTGAAASAADVLGVSGANITGVDANADRIVFWDDSASKLAYLEAGSGLSLSGTTLSATGGGVTTGSVDNAIIRANGTGGSTSQGSDINIEDATTSTANNVTISNQHSGQTNSSLVLTPKGTGAFIVGPKPDGAATVGGNARGSRAVDLQLERAAATQVASGANAFAAGTNCTASAIQSVAIGSQSTASGNYSFSVGRINTASAVRSACIGGQGGDANRVGSVVFSVDEGSNGIRQRIHAMLRNNTTNATPTELWINPTDSYRFTIPSGKVVSGIINCLGVKSDGSQVAQYIREFCMKNVGGTTTLVSSSTIGTDTEDNASTDISVEANDTNDALRIYVTGIASETWRWVASVDAVETTYAS